MKFCSNCGNELFDEAVVCPKCGSAVGKFKAVGDSKGTAWTVIGFLFPILGIILYLIWRDDRPLRSESIIKGVRIIIYILLGLILLSLIITVSLGMIRISPIT